MEAAKLALNKGNKQKALLALRKKKYQEQLLEKTEQQLMNLEELVCKIFIFPILQQANLHFFSTRHIL